MVLLGSIVAAVIPALIYITIIYWFDRYEKEPAWLLGATFLWGAVPSILLAFVLNAVGSLPFYAVGGEELGNAAGAILIAPFVEESVKSMALLAIFLLYRDEIDSLLDGIIYGAMVGMGFAVVENIVYFVEVFEQGGAEAWGSLVFLRAIIFGLNHSLFTAMTGLGLAIGRFSPHPAIKIIAPIAGWAAAVFLHTVHNLASVVAGPLCLVLPLTDWGGVWLLAVIIVWSVWQEKQWIKRYLAEEVGWGTLTRTQYERAQSERRRTRHRLNTLFSAGIGPYLRVRRFYHLCSELAYKKRHYQSLGEQRALDLTLLLRARIADLSRRI